MTELILDGAAVADREDLHARMAKGLCFPEYYGGNLDALHDCLSEIGEETIIRVIDPVSLERTLGPYAWRFLKVLCYTAAEAPELKIDIEQ